jgi:hypothetical protein
MSKKVLTTNNYGVTPRKERFFDKEQPADSFVSETLSPNRPKTSRGISDNVLYLAHIF